VQNRRAWSRQARSPWSAPGDAGALPHQLTFRAATRTGSSPGSAAS